MMQMAKPMPGKSRIGLSPGARLWGPAGGHGVTWAGGLSPLKMGQMRFQMGMAPVLWNCPRASSM